MVQLFQGCGDMKKLKLCFALAAAAQMSVAQVAVAANLVNAGNRIEVSELQMNYLSQDNSFDEIYQRNYAMLGGQNRAILSEWNSEFGTEKLPEFKTERSKSETGAEVLSLTGTKFGKTYTFKLSSDMPDSFEINGVKVSMNNFQNPKSILAQLSLDDELDMREIPKVSNWDKDSALTAKQFAALAPKNKVIYLQKFRQALEAAEKVHKKSNSKLSARPKSEHFSFIELLLRPHSAWAEGAGFPQVNGQCLVAGNSGTYLMTGTGGLSCFPQYDDVATKILPSCGGGKQVVCNPLVYGLSSSGSPYCLDSSNRSEFTASATAQCNMKSPLLGEEGSVERNKSYERILKSYFVAKNGKENESAISKCFNSDAKVSSENEKCLKMFDDQISGFQSFLSQTIDACDTDVTMKTMVDQQSACTNLRERALSLSTYTDELKGGLAIIKVDKKAPAGKTVAEKAEKKKCKIGKKISCAGGLWFLGIGAGILALLLLRKGQAKTPPPVVPPLDVVIPPVVTTPITVTPSTPAVDCSEFGSCPAIPVTPASGRP
jgi:hypothetical protein